MLRFRHDTGKSVWRFMGAGAALLMFASLDAASAQTVLRLNSVTPNDPGNIDTAQLQKLAERVEEKSGGELVLDIHYSSSLVPQDQAFDAVSSGIVDATWFTGSHYASQVPEMDLYSLPFNFASHTDFAEKHLEAGINEILDEALREKGVEYISGFPSSAMTLIMTDKEVKNKEDLAGLQIRVFGPALATATELLGASPVYIPFSELEVALDRGVADGYFTGWGTMATFPGLRRVSKYVIWPPFQGSLGISLVVNKAKYDSLDPELQQALNEAAAEVVREGEEWFAEKEAAARETLATEGVEFTELSEEEYGEWRETISPIWQDYIEKARSQSEAAGERAEKIVNIVSGQ
jgi:TRAP-type transport system periplasmic protein